MDVRDPGTAAHAAVVGRWCEDVAAELGLGPRRAELVGIAGLLHDVGKLGVPDAVLLKAGPLTKDDLRAIQRHPEIGGRMLGRLGIHDIEGWVRAHHERPDGRGYPDGLGADEIPIEAKILAVADAFEAMTSDRVYRPALAVDEAAGELRRAAGSQFDTEVVEVFLARRASSPSRDALAGGVVRG
jgi:HD-GYP domain-containing protein (c-di-GMP phosphodiesterase class II)